MRCGHAKESDLDKVCELLAKEFFDDPVHKFMFSEHNERQEVLRDFFRIYVNLAKKYGGVLLSENNAGTLVYFRPEAMDMADEDIAIVDNQLRKVCGPNYKTATALINGLDQYRPISPHYYISLLAVQRSCRGGRVVRDLFNELNTMLDKDNFPCYAECTRFSTRTLIRRWGYSDAGPPLRIEGFSELFPVWREPEQYQVTR